MDTDRFGWMEMRGHPIHEQFIYLIYDRAAKRGKRLICKTRSRPLAIRITNFLNDKSDPMPVAIIGEDGKMKWAE